MAIWKSIKGYDNQYWISDEGQVISLGNKTRKTRILKPVKDKDGYLRINLYKNRKLKNYLVHRLVAEAFIPNPDNLPCVNHKSEIVSENFVDNLEWCDIKYNTNYGTRNQRIAEKLSKPVLQYDKQGNFIKEYPSTREVERKTGFFNPKVSDCCRGKSKSAYGYIWKYKEERAA